MAHSTAGAEQKVVTATTGGEEWARGWVDLLLYSAVRDKKQWRGFRIFFNYFASSSTTTIISSANATPAGRVAYVNLEQSHIYSPIISSRRHLLTNNETNVPSTGGGWCWAIAKKSGFTCIIIIFYLNVPPPLSLSSLVSESHNSNTAVEEEEETQPKKATDQRTFPERNFNMATRKRKKDEGKVRLHPLWFRLKLLFGLNVVLHLLRVDPNWFLIASL